jgi:DNA-binding transcriptional MocR family regulator
MNAEAEIDWEKLYAGRAAGMRASEIRELLKVLDQPDVISFAGGIPDPALFPTEEIRDAYARVLSDPVLGPQALQYSVSEGYAPLRRWIAAHMASLGVACGVDNIVITSGSQQGLDFLGKLLLSPGDTALVTRPTYLGALQAFSPYEPRYDTLRPAERVNDPQTYAEDAKAAGGRVALAYVVPDFANPTGETLSEVERRNLLDLAAALQIPLIEDVAYRALRYEGEPVRPMLALDIERCGDIERSRVIYCGTFSKTIAPGLRVGWICAARELVHKVVLAKQAGDLHTSTLNQMVMADVVQRLYDRQTPTLISAYRARRDAMLAALARHMPEGVRWTRPEGGMFVWVTLPDGLDGAELLAAALQEERVAFVPGSAFFDDRGGRNTLRLNFTLQSPGEIEEGLGRLGALLRRRLAAGAGAAAARA